MRLKGTAKIESTIGSAGEGENKQRVYGIVVHAEIRAGKIWIQYDGIEDSITEELVAMGVPKNSIVLGFHPPELRQYTGYAVT